MRSRSLIIGVGALWAAAAASAEVPAGLKPYIKEDAQVLVLNHVRIIDGTGAAAREDQRIDIAAGRIERVQSARLRNAFPKDARVLDLTGRTVIPGLIGMHEHFFYPLPDPVADGVPLYGEMADSAPRLYLAAGVTSARTTGSVEPYADLAVRELINAGKIPGPKLDITGPYIGDLAGRIPQLHTLTGPEDAARTVDYWAAQGVTSFKAYMSIKPEELKAAIEHAHAHHLKITGHLCAVGFCEAAALGIDNLEHGIVVDTEFYPDKKPGVCPAREAVKDLVERVEVESAPVQDMIRTLVAHHVAVTSTLAVFEISVPNRPPLETQTRVRQALTAQAWAGYLQTRGEIAEQNRPQAAVMLRKEMQFERDFVRAGGLLLAGADPTSFGGVVPGYADQRNLELLVEAGFTPVEAIHIATQNGAVFQGQEQSVGSIQAGRAADLIVIKGNPAEKIDEVENVETVFKDGLGYDPARLTQSVQGRMGLR